MKCSLLKMCGQRQNYSNYMKSKLSLLIVAGLMAWSLAGQAQKNSGANNTAPAASNNNEAAQPASAPDAGTAPAATPDAPPATGNAAAQPATDAPATTTSPAPATGDATPAAVDPPTAATSQDNAATATAVTPEAPAPNGRLIAANEPAQQKPATPAPVVTNAAPAAPVIPLIVMDDVPLTDAIKNLARQAGLNYMLDPKISFGQPGPNGAPAPQPSVSIRWENITAEQALQALLNNYSLQLVEDPKTKIARVTTKDPAAPDPLVTKIIQLKYASPSNVVSSVQAALTDKRSKVMGDVRTSQLVVVATEKELADVDQLIEKLDTITKQVLIETRLLETSFNPSTSKGVDWSGTVGSQHVAFGNNLQVNAPNQSVNNTLSQSFPKLLLDTARGFNPATAFLDMDGVNAVISFLNQYAEAKVISSPRTVTLDNEPAKIEVTRASPIINITPGTVQVSGGSQITYTNLGVILNVTPRISANNYVNLKVIPEVSRVSDTVTRSLGVAGIFQADAYAIRRMETRVLIPSGNTLVLGGLVQDDVRVNDIKVPLLGDIPFLGRAFRSESKNRLKSNLLVFVTPTIVQDSDYHPTKTDFLNTPTPTSDNVDKEWTAWDSGKPHDWSKPASTSEATAYNK
jgi:type II secretory pathway component GspD/PulD (secretin)